MDCDVVETVALFVGTTCLPVIAITLNCWATVDQLVFLLFSFDVHPN